MPRAQLPSTLGGWGLFTIVGLIGALAGFVFLEVLAQLGIV